MSTRLLANWVITLVADSAMSCWVNGDCLGRQWKSNCICLTCWGRPCTQLNTGLVVKQIMSSRSMYWVLILWMICCCWGFAPKRVLCWNGDNGLPCCLACWRSTCSCCLRCNSSTFDWRSSCCCCCLFDFWFWIFSVTNLVTPPGPRTILMVFWWVIPCLSCCWILAGQRFFPFGWGIEAQCCPLNAYELAKSLASS